MPKRWIYGTPNPGGELTKKDKIILSTVSIATIGLAIAVGYILWSLVH